MPIKTHPPSYTALIDAGEPFRLLFPVGFFLGIIGVMLWPAHAWAGIPYPLQAHTGIMIQGFLTSFILGFLGTSLPRLLEVPHLRLRRALSYAAALLLISLLHLFGQPVIADTGFLLLLIAFLGDLARRARQRQDIPPPGFVLVFMGMLCALAGIILQIGFALNPEALPPSLTLLGKKLLQQGYLLLPIMGVGAFLLPRFFGLPSRHSFPESMTPPPGWWPRALFAASCGGIVLLSFVLESQGWWRTAYGLRAGALLLFFFCEVPLHKGTNRKGSLAWALAIALASIPLGYATMAIFPQWQSALIHITFITGFSLLIFTVATRVILGHGGQEAKFHRPLKSIIAMTALLILAMLTRVTADWLPEIRYTHYGYAAFTWVIGALVWAWAILPAVQRADE